MNKYFRLIKNPITILIVFAVLFIIPLLIYILLPVTGKTQVQPTPSVEKSPQQDFTTDKNLLSKTALSSTEARYLFKSSRADRPNEIIANTSDNKIIFQRRVLPQDDQTPTLTNYLDQFGDPENLFEGSKYYGDAPTVYIYATKGIAFIGNEDNKIVEVQEFQPTTVEDYIQRYGEDIVVHDESDE